jgi:hypothetical protein
VGLCFNGTVMVAVVTLLCLPLVLSESKKAGGEEIKNGRGMQRPEKLNSNTFLLCQIA